jgi:hypothetical protein
MARAVKTPPILQPAREQLSEKDDVLRTSSPAPQRVTGVGERGTEQGVPFEIDGAGRKFVAAPHPQAGNPW